MTPKELEAARKYLSEIGSKGGRSRSPAKLAALAENRPKPVENPSKSTLYQRERRARLKRERGGQ